ncbi:MAG: GHKL domain-containing protein [Planctomycetes bacterium]|nr:GHKL domain-containing protein [Planctomycetota bacterium]
MTPSIDVRSSARLVTLARILLFALSVGVIFFMGIIELVSFLGDKDALLTWLFVFVAVAATILTVISSWVKRPSTLIMHLVFDMLWISAVVYLCGGTLGPASILIFAVVIISCLVLPGVFPFLFSTLGSFLLIGIAYFYSIEVTPYESPALLSIGDMHNKELILSTVIVQVLALYLIDILGQTLGRRVSEQQIVVGDLLDQIGDGILLVDNAGRIRHINDQAIRFLDLQGDFEGDVLPSLLKAGHAGELANILHSGQGLRSMHLTINKRYLLVTANDVHGRRGLTYGRMLSLRDESSLRNLEDNMRRAEHLASLGELAAGIAHEFRNPLTSLRGCAQEIKDISKQEGALQSRKLAKIIVTESDRLSRIVEDILGFSRQHSLYLQGMGVQEFLEEIGEYYKHRKDVGESVAIDIEVAAHCPRIFSDPEKLRQIFTNLIDNALHACAENQQSRILLKAEGLDSKVLEDAKHSVCISVEDNGVGIEPSLIRQIFTPFYSTRSQGTGIGLALVQRLVRALGGIIKIESEVGNGTQAYVYIPQIEDTSKSGIIDVG